MDGFPSGSVQVAARRPLPALCSPAKPRFPFCLTPLLCPPQPSGLISTCLLNLEEFERALSSSHHFLAAALFTGAGLVLAAVSFPFLYFPATFYYCPSSGAPWLLTGCEWFGEGAVLGFPCGGSYTHEFVGLLSLESMGVEPLTIPAANLCSKALSNFAFAYGVTATIAGTVLLLLLVGRSQLSILGFGPPPALLVKLGSSLASEGQLFGANITGLRVVAACLLAYAVGAALSLTYYFPPYADLDNGFLACWLAVAAAALLLRDEPAPPPPSDEEANNSSGAPPPVPAPAKPPYAPGLALCSGLLIVAAVHRAHYAARVDLGVECTWAIVCASLSLIGLLLRLVVRCCATSLSPSTSATLRLLLALPVAGCWLVAAFLLTFLGPFVDPGNGYIATWGGVLCACGLLLAERSESGGSGAEAGAEAERGLVARPAVVQPAESGLVDEAGAISSAHVGIISSSI